MIPWHTKLDATHRCPAGHFYRCAKGDRCTSEEEVLPCDLHVLGGHRRHRQERDTVPPKRHFHRCYVHGGWSHVDVKCDAGVKSSHECPACLGAEERRLAASRTHGQYATGTPSLVAASL